MPVIQAQTCAVATSGAGCQWGTVSSNGAWSSCVGMQAHIFKSYLAQTPMYEKAKMCSGTQTQVDLTQEMASIKDDDPRLVAATTALEGCREKTTAAACGVASGCMCDGDGLCTLTRDQFYVAAQVSSDTSFMPSFLKCMLGNADKAACNSAGSCSWSAQDSMCNVDGSPCAAVSAAKPATSGNALAGLALALVSLAANSFVA